MSGGVPDLDRLRELRRALHAAPELAGGEIETAARIIRFLEPYEPERIETGVGGHGVLAIFENQAEAPGDGGQTRHATPATVVLRAELDGLPITERGTDRPHLSQVTGVAHACGHDGHMAMLAGVAPWLRAEPVPPGRVVLLFQPAEETGQGARLVAADPRFQALAPDWIFALHNLPGYPLGTALLRSGPLAAASVGLAITLGGRTAHAAHPEQGRSPAAAASRLIPRLAGLGAGSGDGLALVTVVHVRIGERSFGTAPGEGDLLATLRADSDEGLAELREAAATAAREEAGRDGIDVELNWHDAFPATVNDPAATALAERACTEHGLTATAPLESPFRWSEDLGWLLRETPGALVGLGSGIAQPVLHAPDYDFPDALLPVGVALLARLAALGVANPRPRGEYGRK